MALTDNLLAFYKLSDTSDSSGNNNTLTNNGDVQFVAGKLGNAAEFNGSNYLSIDTSIQESTPGTYSVWLKQSSQNSTPLVIGQSGAANISIREDGFIGCYVAASENYDVFVSDIVANSNEWNNVVLTVQNGFCRLYVNGNLKQTFNDTGYGGRPFGTLIQPGTIYIGGEGQGEFNGQIDAVGIWNRALSDSEVAELYNNGTGLELTVTPTVNLINGLQAFYKLSDTSDSSGNNNTLTNNGDVTFAPGKIGDAAVFDGGSGLNILDVVKTVPKTISVWMNSSGGDGYRLVTMLTDTSSWGVYIQMTEGNGLRVGYDGSGGDFVTYDSTIENDAWYHVLVVNDGNNSKLYINGSLNNQAASTFPENYNAISIGSGWNGQYDFFNGKIDAVGMWNRALSDAEIAELYNNGTGLELEVIPQTLVKLQAPVKLFGKVKFGA